MDKKIIDYTAIIFFTIIMIIFAVKTRDNPHPQTQSNWLAVIIGVSLIIAGICAQFLYDLQFELTALFIGFGIAILITCINFRK